MNRQVLLSALVSSGVTLALSPLAIVMAFQVNAYLSRPILSVEYVDLLPELAGLPVPKAELAGLLQSPGYQAYVTSGHLGSPANLLMFQGQEGDLSADNVRTLAEATHSYVDIITTRNRQLSDAASHLFAGPSEEQIREVALELNGPAGRYQLLQGTPDALKESLAAEIQNELKMNAESLTLAQSLADRLEGFSEPRTGSLRVKVSLLNRGDTDGLVRDEATLLVPAERLSIALKRSAPPERPPPAGGAVPVMLAGAAAPANDLGTIGKIEKHSLTERWFGVDEDASMPSDLAALAELVKKNSPTELEVVLFDHERRPLSSPSVRLPELPRRRSPASPATKSVPPG